jgi:flagellar assembly factor FliW
MKLETTRFGAMDVPEADVYTFSEGLLGFADARRFALLDGPKGGPFRWLQSADDPSLAFVVADPAPFFADYRVRVREEDLASVGLKDVAEGSVLVILTVPRDPRQITANLQGPLVLNRGARRARQLILAEPGLTTRHRLFKDEA